MNEEQKMQLLKEIQIAQKTKLQEIKAVADDDNKADINGRTYQLSKMTHKQRLPFIQYFNDVQPNPITGLSIRKDDLSVKEDMLAPYVLFENATLKNLPNHFDKYPDDYLTYIDTMFMVVCFPVLKERLLGTQG